VRRWLYDELQQSRIVDHIESVSAGERLKPGARVRRGPSAQSVDALLRALRQRLRDARPLTADQAECPPVDGALRQALGRLSTEAHADGLSAAQVLIVFKSVLDSIPELRALDATVSAAESGRAVRAHLVTACIEAYYAHDVAEPTPASADVEHP
jgi:hypothetical protein